MLLIVRMSKLKFIFFPLFIFSCKKFVQIDPPITAITRESVYNSDATAIAVVTGLYTNMSSGAPFTGSTSFSVSCGLSADEFTLYPTANNTQVIAFYRNALTGIQAPAFFSVLYKSILLVNSAIEGLNKSNSLTFEVKRQLLGEALFLRAFYYFYLVNLYGDVPLVISSDWRVNESMPRTSKDNIYLQIIADLKEAKELLSNDYLSSGLVLSTIERIRPNKWTATALLSRVYLFIGDWIGAEMESSTVINNSNKYVLEKDLKKVFLKNSSESIWQLQPVNLGWNTEDAKVFVLTSSGPNASSQPIYLSKYLLNKFEFGDQRKVRWVDSVIVSGTTYYYPSKYKVSISGNAVTEYLMVLRLSEQYLIRAEARAQQNNLQGAISDVDEIRQRAQLALLLNINPSINKLDLIEAIHRERQVELFSEWGNRWLDLKRSGNIDLVMKNVTPQKGGSWDSYRQYYPLSQSDALYFNLSQTSGY